MEKLSRLDELCDRIIEDTNMTMLDAIHDLDAIISAPLRYNFAIRCVFMCTCSATCGILFFGLPLWGWITAGILGIFLECLDYVIAQRFQNARLIFEVAGAMAVGFLCHVIGDFYPALCPNTTGVAAIIWLVPGLELTLAFYEFSSRYLVSASIRLLWAMISYIMFAFGLGTGSELVVWKHEQLEVDEGCTTDVAWPWRLFVALPLMCLSFAVLFQGLPRHLPVMTLVGCVVFLVQDGLLRVFAYGASTMLAAVVLGLLGNTFARIEQRPSSIVIISGVLVLVPGGMGVKGMESLFYDPTSGEGMGKVLHTVISIAVGILFANVVLPPRKQMRGLSLKDLSM